MNITPTTEELSNKHVETKSDCLTEFNFEIKNCDEDKKTDAVDKLGQVAVYYSHLTYSKTTLLRTHKGPKN
jgi:hypothetical protein